MNGSGLVKWVAASAMVLLAACSGGGDVGESGGIPTPTATLSTTAVSIDSSVPPSIAAAISDVMSPTSAGTIPGSLQIETIPGSDSMLLAMDANGKLRLAAMASGPTTTFNAESTAVALVRIAIGVRPSGISASQTNQIIRATAEFQALVRLVEDAIKTDLSPLDYFGVADSVAVTTGQAVDSFSNILGGTSVTTSALAFATTPVITPLPFNIVSSLSGVASVYVTSANRDGSVNLVNATLIAWVASSYDETGHLLRAPSTNDGKILLPPSSSWAILANKLAPWDVPQSIKLPGNNGKGLDAILEQTPQSRLINTVGVIAGVAKLTLSLLGGESLALMNKCEAGVESALISTGELEALAAEPSMDGFKAYLKSLAFQSPVKMHNLFKDCIPNGKSVAAEFLGKLSGILTVLSEVGKVYDSTTLLVKAKLLGEYWDAPPKDVAVCIAGSSFLGIPEIQNCVKKFKFDNPAPILVPNARFTPRITALTSGDAPTGLPIGITHKSSDTVQAVVTVLTPQDGTPQTGELVANGVGSATISVRDPFTRTEGNYPVTVVRPVIKPGVVKMGVGQAMALSLTDAGGNLVITDGSGLTWTLENETRETSSTEPVAILGPFSGGATNTANIYARAPGRVTVTVRIPVLFDPITVEVEVSGISGTWSGPYSLRYVGSCTFDEQGTLSMTILQNGTSFSGSWLRDGLDEIDGITCAPTGTTYAISGSVSGTLAAAGEVTTLTGMFKICDACGGATGTEPVTESWTATLGVAPNTMTGKWDSLSYGLVGPLNPGSTILSSSFTLTKQ